jgi:ParB-like chromosome segregation protein Spo0J
MPTIQKPQKRKNTMENKLLAPLSSLQWVDRNLLKPNNYNPNKVSRENLELLTQSIFSNGWTLPIVCRLDYTIIDGFHRWLVSGPDWTYKPVGKKQTLFELLGGKVPRVIVKHTDKSGDIYGTVTHNRARGTHLLEPMKNIVKLLLSQGKTTKEIGKELGMKPEEVFRLSDLSKEQFLAMMASRSDGYSKELYMRNM